MEDFFYRILTIFESTYVGVLLKRDLVTHEDFIKWIAEKYPHDLLDTRHYKNKLEQTRCYLYRNVGSLDYYSVYEDREYDILRLTFKDGTGKKVMVRNFSTRDK